MNFARKMIGLSKQVYNVSRVPNDYGTGGTPSLVVKTIKGTNHFKRVEFGQDKLSLNQIAFNKVSTSPKQPLKSVIHSYADSECSPNPSKVVQVSAPPPLYFVLRRTPNDYSTDKESSKRGQNYRPTCQAGPEPPDKDSGRSLKFLTFHKTDGGKLYPFQTHSILNTIKNKQSESHPTGSFDWKHRKGISPAVPLEPRTRLLHRTIERYHE